MILEKRTGDERELEMPERCPVCGTPIVRDPDAVRHYCPNPLCPARVGQEFGHFVGRGAMDIEGAGWKVLSQLLERGLVKTRGDFFRLTRRGSRVAGPIRAQERREPQGVDREGARPAAAPDHPRPGHPAGWRPDGGRPVDAGSLRRWPPADDEPMGGHGGWFDARGEGAARRLPPEDSRRSRASGRRSRRASSAGSPIRPRPACSRTWSTPASSRSGRLPRPARPRRPARWRARRWW